MKAPNAVGAFIMQNHAAKQRLRPDWPRRTFVKGFHALFSLRLRQAIRAVCFTLLIELLEKRGHPAEIIRLSCPYLYSLRWLALFCQTEQATALYNRHFLLIDVTIIPVKEIMRHRSMAALTLLQKHNRQRDLRSLINRLFSADLTLRRTPAYAVLLLCPPARY